MNLFSQKKPQEAAAAPQIDDIQAKIGDKLRGRMLTGRAANMLSAGGQAPTAQRQVLGN